MYIEQTRTLTRLLLLAGLTALVGCAATDEDHIVNLYEESSDAARGGQLWDEWWAVDGVGESIAPGGEGLDENGDALPSSLPADNPYYMAHKPAENTRSGAQTWRCKECHGWDYKGADGAYESGSHATGFPGVMGARDKDIGVLYAAIARGELSSGTEEGHAFGPALSEQDVVDLVAFVREAIIETDDYIDPVTKTPTVGDAEAGNAEFNTNCASCHGLDGQKINFDGGPYRSEFIPDAASDNPWEVLHKIRFGQPGESMPTAVDKGYRLEDAAGILAYAQSLGNPEVHGASMWHGGALYDEWWKVTGADEPAGTNPLYADTDYSQGTMSGPNTWRCKECHGWDYKGKDGRFASGPEFTGIKGLWEAADKGASTLYDTLYSGIFTDAAENVTGTHTGHAFGENGQLSEGDVKDLVRFVKEGLIDDDLYIDSLSGLPLGSAVAGAADFAGNCATCHGSRGTEMNFADEDDIPASEYVGTVARDNIWELFHKIRFGNPGSEVPHEHADPGLGVEHHREGPMPNLLVDGYSLTEAANLARFATTLPDPQERGGQLYDRWWNVQEIPEPIPPGGSIVLDDQTFESSVPADNPYFMANRPDSNTRSGNQTWRCKECHGWDYKGAAGHYGSGSHSTGFPGVWDAHTTADAEAIFTAISEGPPGMADSHAFGPLIGEDGVRDLTNFIIDGVIATEEFFDADGHTRPFDSLGGDDDDSAASDPAPPAVHRTRDANWFWGQVSFNGNCANCHGTDGRRINFGAPDEFEVVSTVANDNPWEIMHKLRSGQPGSDPSMPNAAGTGYDLEDVLDIITYAQSLPE